MGSKKTAPQTTTINNYYGNRRGKSQKTQSTTYSTKKTYDRCQTCGRKF